jgi:hypothetical protein
VLQKHRPPVWDGEDVKRVGNEIFDDFKTLGFTRSIGWGRPSRNVNQNPGDLEISLLSFQWDIDGFVSGGEQTYGGIGAGGGGGAARGEFARTQ